jgi:hypothetical protein
MNRRRILAWTLLALCANAAEALPGGRQIFQEGANARQLISSAVATASRERKNVVLIFGANW